MTVDEFLAWSETAPGRHELVGGEVVAMAPERVQHARLKFAVQKALDAGLAGHPCEMLPDGMTVRIDEHTAYEPDALVTCEGPLDPHAVEVRAPVIVVEVLSPGTRRFDERGKLVEYFRLPSLHHYLLVDPDRRRVIHHRRAAEAIETRIVATGLLHLDPPGVDLPLDVLFARS
ncbi:MULTISPECIES: Uma2 family endonuclease [unclassified Methylobacterium]|uniref:Uma2 family endonuclease n=1 Tax=unclassified Methylobacterium TaxID=2615210 RepID=UPI0002E63007|nr:MULTISPECIES: Uma2 family endonuclease [Methylobacterium]WFT81840.1 Uma2 family endonuclease [Methylobacterium nodulans]